MVITFNDIVFGICDRIEDNGNTFTMINDDFRCKFTKSTHKFYDVPISKDIEPIKYCYTEADGFYLNPNWHEPSAYDLAPTDVVDAIIDEYTNELIEMGVL